MQGYLACWSSPPCFLQQVRTVRGTKLGTFLTEIWGTLQRRVGIQEHGEQLKPEIRCFFSEDGNYGECGGNEAGSGFKILPNMRANNDDNGGVLLSLHRIKVAFFSHKVTFTTRKSSSLTTSIRIYIWSNWFLLWQSSSTLASWASRKLMSLMKRQSEDLRLFFLKVFLVLFWGFLHQKKCFSLLNLSCSFVCFHVAAFYFWVDGELHTYMTSSMCGVKTSNFIADKCWTKVEMWCWRSFQSLIRSFCWLLSTVWQFFPSENNCYFPLQFHRMS